MLKFFFPKLCILSLPTDELYLHIHTCRIRLFYCLHLLHLDLFPEHAQRRVMRRGRIRGFFGNGYPQLIPAALHFLLSGHLHENRPRGCSGREEGRQGAERPRGPFSGRRFRGHDVERASQQRLRCERFGDVLGAENACDAIEEGVSKLRSQDSVIKLSQPPSIDSLFKVSLVRTSHRVSLPFPPSIPSPRLLCICIVPSSRNQVQSV